MSYTTDNSGSLIPVARDYRYYPYAESPAAETSQSYLDRGVRPQSVIVNSGRGAVVSFAFQPDITVKGTSYIDFGAMTGSVELDIHPVAWKATPAGRAIITFVYKGEV